MTQPNNNRTTNTDRRDVGTDPGKRRWNSTLNLRIDSPGSRRRRKELRSTDEEVSSSKGPSKEHMRDLSSSFFGF